MTWVCEDEYEVDGLGFEVADVVVGGSCLDAFPVVLSTGVEFSFGTETKILRLPHLRGERSRTEGESGLYAGNILVRDELEELSV